MGSGRHVSADPRRLRLCRGVRHRAQIPRNAALSDSADLDQFDPVVPRRTRSRAATFLLSGGGGGGNFRFAVAATRRLGGGFAANKKKKDKEKGHREGEDGSEEQ